MCSCLHACSCCSKGERGPRGPQGIQGIQGVPGVEGEPGQQGIQGEQGLQGIQGIQGLPGTNGTDGTNGTNGTNGIDGMDGAPGPQGDPGPQGIPGDPGPAWANHIVLENDFTTSGAANAANQITDLTFPVLAGKTYYIEAFLRATSTATGNGAYVTFASPDLLSFDFVSLQTTIPNSTLLSTTGVYSAGLNSPLSPVLGSTSISPSTNGMCIVRGILRWTIDSTIVMAVGSEGASPASITIGEGSVLFYKQLD